MIGPSRLLHHQMSSFELTSCNPLIPAVEAGGRVKKMIMSCYNRQQLRKLKPFLSC